MNPRVDLLMSRFLARLDCVAVLAPWKKPCPVDFVGQEMQTLLAHLEGERVPQVSLPRMDNPDMPPLVGRFRVGAYAPDPDGNTPWLGIDVDGKGHAYALADPLTAVLRIKSAFDSHGIPSFIELSGGGRGWHLWVFFDPIVAAAKARRLALRLIPRDIPLADGGFADPEKGQGIEVFPKQNTIAPDGLGSMLWLPWWNGAKGDACQFHRLSGASSLRPYIPESFQTIDEVRLDTVLADLIPPPSAPVPTTAPSPRPVEEPTAEQDNNAWGNWRPRALAALSLEAVYGPWLTGEPARSGWLKCRIPWSPTGDRDPSGGVADGTGEAERAAFHDFVSAETISVFDFLIKNNQAKDFKEACQIVANLSGVPLPTYRSTTPDQFSRIEINNRQLRDVVADTWDAIRRVNEKEPSLFVRSGELVHVVEVDGRLAIKRHTQDSVFGHIARVADWVKVSNNGSTSVSPSRDVAKDLLAYPDPALPALDGIATTPVLSSGGRLLRENGYHRDERLLLVSGQGLHLPPIPDRPTAPELTRARHIIVGELLGDFPFVSDADLAHAVAGLLLPIVRRMITGVTPLHVVSAPTPGSGKGLICDVISICAEGSPCAAQPISSKEEEIRKMITAQLSDAHPIILLDNASERRRIDSPSLAAVLTTEVSRDRILKESRTVSLPNRALWMLTGNNPQFSMEIARRSIRIRIDPQMDQPWRRGGFRHENLREWAMSNRSDLLAALFVFVRTWQAAGSPLNSVRLGNFEHWSQIIGGILTVAGIPGFLTNLDDFYSASDAEGAMWREFVTAWWDANGTKPQRIGELRVLCESEDLMVSVRGDGLEKSQDTRLGLAIQRTTGRVFGQHRIVLDKDNGKKGKTYTLEVVGESAGLPEGDLCPKRGTFETRSPQRSPGAIEDGSTACESTGDVGDLFEVSPHEKQETE